MLLGKAGLPVVELWGFHDGWACFFDGAGERWEEAKGDKRVDICRLKWEMGVWYTKYKFGGCLVR